MEPLSGEKNPARDAVRMISFFWFVVYTEYTSPSSAGFSLAGASFDVAVSFAAKSVITSGVENSRFAGVSPLCSLRHDVVAML